MTIEEAKVLVKDNGDANIGGVGNGTRQMMTTTKDPQSANRIEELCAERAKLQSIISDLGGDPTPITAPKESPKTAEMMAYMQGPKYRENLNHENGSSVVLQKEEEEGEEQLREKTVADMEDDIQRMRTIAWTLQNGPTGVEERLRRASSGS